MSPIFQVKKHACLDEEKFSSLVFLYGPLISKDAFYLYCLLLNWKDDDGSSLAMLLETSNLSTTRLEKARKELEQYHLLTTYYNAFQNSWLFVIENPKYPKDFLQHDIYSRVYLEKRGSKDFDRKKVLYATDPIEENYVDVSEKIDISILQNWNEDKEKALHQKNVFEEDHRYPFDFGLLFQGMDRILPQRLRSKKNLERIYELARIFGVDEKTMRRYLHLSVSKDGQIDFESLRERLLRAKKTKLNIKDPYGMSPVAYLQHKQHDMPVAKADKLTIEKCMKAYQLPNEVMNVLIDYALDKGNQTFNSIFVEKVASSWARLKIDTKEKALAQISSRKSSAKEDLPDWYANTQTTQPDENLNTEIQDLLQSLKGEDYEH